MGERRYVCRDGQLRTLQEIEERAAVQREQAKGRKVEGMQPSLMILDEALDLLDEGPEVLTCATKSCRVVTYGPGEPGRNIVCPACFGPPARRP